MRRLLGGFAFALLTSTAAMAATKDATTSVIIACKCVDKYSQWLCETFWWLLC